MAKSSSSKITAHREGETREFTQEVWDQFPPDKYGWKRSAEKPAEVKKLEAEQGKGSSGKTSEKEEPKVNAAELADKIYKAKTPEAVDALVPDGETRKTVLEAAEKRKAELSEKE